MNLLKISLNSIDNAYDFLDYDTYPFSDLYKIASRIKSDLIKRMQDKYSSSSFIGLSNDIKLPSDNPDIPIVFSFDKVIKLLLNSINYKIRRDDILFYTNNLIYSGKIHTDDIINAMEYGNELSHPKNIIRTVILKITNQLDGYLVDIIKEVVA